MRDINRIDIVCNKLAEVWKKVPDWRFMQLMNNLMRFNGTDMFYTEDDQFIEELNKMLK